jgi:DNA-binding response OmpR family regulator
VIDDSDSRAPADQLEKELQKLRVRFSGKLPGRVRDLGEEWERLQGAGWNTQGARALHRSVHGLVGTAGSLGFAQVSKAARVVERELLGLLESVGAPTTGDADEVHRLVASIGNAVKGDEKAFADGTSTESQRVPVEQIFEARNLIVVVEQEGPFARELALQLGHFGFELQMYQNLDDVAEAEFGRRPAAVIVDLSVPEGEVAAVEAAQFVRNAVGEDVPVVFVSNRSDIEARLDAVRAGCRGYFVKPVNYSGVLETLDRLTRCEPDPYRILIVDDETEAAEFHSLSLESAGLETVIVTEPLDVTAQLVEFRPDVILIDLYMPGCSGQELAKVIRQEEAFVGVPIVFLSRETDRMKQIAALGETGDDFFTKPVPPDELVP